MFVCVCGRGGGACTCRHACVRWRAACVCVCSVAVWYCINYIMSGNMRMIQH